MITVYGMSNHAVTDVRLVQAHFNIQSFFVIVNADRNGESAFWPLWIVILFKYIFYVDYQRIAEILPD